MISSMGRGESVTQLLGLLDGSGPSHMIDGDIPDASTGSLRPDGLARALDGLLHQATGAPEQPAWWCTLRSSPDLPDPTDAEWSQFSRRVLAAAEIAPTGDREACRWAALRAQPRTVHIMAILIRQDSQPIPRTHGMYQAVWRESQRIGTEYASRYPDAPVTIRPAADLTFSAPSTVVITRRPSGSVAAYGGDSLADTLLDRAGFPNTADVYGSWRLLPAGMPHHDQAAIASHAAEMLRAARYQVTLDEDLRAAGTTAHTGAHSLYQAGTEVLHLTDQIRAADNGTALEDALDLLLHPEHGALERVREALETASEQITDLDPETYGLADRFGFAADFVTAAQSELLDYATEVQGLGTKPAQTPNSSSSASPSAAKQTTTGITAPAAKGSTAPPAGGPPRSTSPRQR
jgi:hypothetical protein